MATLKTLIIMAILAYAGVLALMYVFQRSLMYFPDRSRTPPAAAGLPQAEEVTLKSADGESLLAWYVPPQESPHHLFPAMAVRSICAPIALDG
jgi:hypothetical protein